MYLRIFDVLAELPVGEAAKFRLVSMLVILVGAVTAGHLASSRFGVSEKWARKIMVTELVSTNWVIALLTIWYMKLTMQFIWMPIINVSVLFVITVLSTVIFSHVTSDRKNQLTLIMAGSMSNLGYTGAAFVCYALMGAQGLGMANLSLILWLPATYLTFIPILKAYELRAKDSNARFNLVQMLDARMIPVPAVIAAVVLNLTAVKQPAFITRFHIVDILAYAACTFSFFAIGLRVNLPRLKNYINLYFLLSAIKFILTPIVAILIIWVVALAGQNLNSMVRKVIIVMSVAPTAVAMVTMSNAFNLDGRLASALWVTNTAIFAIIVAPILFFIFA